MKAKKYWCHELDKMIYSNIVQLHEMLGGIKLNKHFNFHQLQVSCIEVTQIVKVYGANIGPTWVFSAPDGPHVGPMNFAIRGRCSPKMDFAFWKYNSTHKPAKISREVFFLSFLVILLVLLVFLGDVVSMGLHHVHQNWLAFHTFPTFKRNFLIELV